MRLIWSGKRKTVGCMGTWCVDGGIFLTPLTGLQVSYARDDDAQSVVMGDWCLAGRLDVFSLEA